MTDWPQFARDMQTGDYEKHLPANDPTFEPTEPVEQIPVLDVDAWVVAAGKESEEGAGQQAEAEQALQLANLLALYDDAERQADEATKAFEAVKTAVKNLGFELRPNEDDDKLEFRSKHLRTPLRMVYIPGRKTIDRKRMDAELPGLAAKYEKVGQPSWTLKRVKPSSEG